MGDDNKKSGFGQTLGMIGAGAAGSAVEAGLGMLLGGWNDRRQRMQQDKLWQMEMKNRKEMTDYEMEKQYEMWLKTNYGAQMKEMKKEGLNPGLIYGMSGGGATTTGSGGGNVSGASAPSGGGEVLGMIGAGQAAVQQAALLKAQVENIKADTEQKKATTEGTGFDNQIKELDAKLRADPATIEAMSWNILNESLKLADEASQTRLNLEFDQESYNERMAEVKARQAIAAFQVTLAEKQITLTEEQINQVKEGIKLGWDRYDLDKWAKEQELLKGRWDEQLIRMFMKNLKQTGFRAYDPAPKGSNQKSK